jgi:hypothetical protein
MESGNKYSRETLVSSTLRESPPRFTESSNLLQQTISRSNTEVPTLHLAPRILRYLNPKSRGDGSHIPLPYFGPRESESSEYQTTFEQDIADKIPGCPSASQEQVLQSGQGQSDQLAPASSQVEVLPKNHLAFSDLAPKNPPN